ncbi:hypothetical protein KAS41_03310 [Candidatus Parcubacteria bacterium]|nr:hypothetical protein [Candidatus Parcubacteria bacterium]
MRKKFYAAVFALIMSVSLSGCHIPILDKEVTMPFFEKKPEKVISLMLDKMQDIKTVKYEADIAVKMHIDQSKIETNFMSFLNNDLNPQVLGESVSVVDANYGESMPLLPTDNMNINMPIFGSGPMDIKYDISFSGTSDNSDKNNPKGETKFNLNFDLGGMEIKMDCEAKFIDKKIYFKAGQLPFPLSLILGQFANQWYELDIEKMQEFQKEEIEKSGMEIDLDAFDFTENKEKIEKLEQRINKIIKDYKIINFDKRLKDEKVDGKKCYRYQVSLNKNNLDRLIKEFIKIFKEEFIDTENSEGVEQEMFNEVLNNPEFNSFLQKLSSIIKKSEGEIWIDKKDFYLRKSTFDFKIDFSGLEFDGEKIPAGALNVDISGNMQYSDFDKPTKIEAPKDAKPLIEEIEKMIQQAIDNSLVHNEFNPTLDSDNDGLTEEEERIYKTNPFNPDTDNDGYSDGDEVKAGYNPNGEGKLDIKLKTIKPVSNIKVDDSFLIGLAPSEVYMEYYNAIQNLDVEKTMNCISKDSVKEIKETVGIDLFKENFSKFKNIQLVNIGIPSGSMGIDDATIIVEGTSLITREQLIRKNIKFIKENGIWKIEVEEYNNEN